jgi:hypothetical protein
MRSRWALLNCADAHGGLQRRSDRPLLRRVTLDFSVGVAEETNPLGTMIAKLSPARVHALQVGQRPMRNYSGGDSLC